MRPCVHIEFAVMQNAAISVRWIAYSQRGVILSIAASYDDRYKMLEREGYREFISWCETNGKKNYFGTIPGR